jgi:hypothetical protein
LLGCASAFAGIVMACVGATVESVAEPDGGANDAAAPKNDGAPLPDDGTVISTVDAGTPTTCATLHAAQPSAVSGVYLIDPDDDGPQLPFKAYCDMDADEGGWTLLITLTPSTITSDFKNPEAWPSTVGTESGPPTTTGLYLGTLAPFHEVREEIASKVVTVYGRNKTEAELEIIRKQYGWQTRLASAATYGDRPACRVAYAGATDDIEGCSNFPTSSATDQSTLGWCLDADPAHPNGCWFARGSGSGVDAGGSSQCDGEVNGTRWARTWFR